MLFLVSSSIVRQSIDTWLHDCCPEQGIGDQIAFLSVIPALLEQGYTIAAIETYPKLRNLIQRTFPTIPVFGTQFTDPAKLPVKHTHVCAMSEVLQYVDLPGKPYLKVEDDQVRQWRLFLPGSHPQRARSR